jgi:hypothetical protein
METQGLGLGPKPPNEGDWQPDLLDRWIWGRFGWLFAALVVSSVFFLLDWGGYRAYPAPWGDTRALSEIWWHFPILFALASGLTYWISTTSD